MFNFFRKSQDSKRVLAPEREADGFVLLGDTVGEQKTASNNKASFPETGTTYTQPLQTHVEDASRMTVSGAETSQGTSQALEGNPLMPELLNDIPFTLAPHILTMQSTFNDLPDQLLSCDINDDHLSRFCYDFTLENSVLCDP
ncbi:UBAP1-MVB12-associated (UMA)-domain containing protein 1 [Rhinatrema bivittatum]|uniref:UBAP1-MVB12-associated (UMA)-domain containing protein 1 n=1 Tax=Rhinatrema bivittatum TaxID=194408 RepID=UPI001128A8C0|nr:UBAP1-MVB12-associated (UMA)-domain containing protein 1 [Rhinatrema bivittatum]XP_029444808.1 UBAP1-MVB12-associated (UMA)-domain containing protein 1 [Rhinatrema bivittatum]